MTDKQRPFGVSMTDREFDECLPADEAAFRSPIPTQMLPLVSPFDLNKYGRNEFLSIEVPLTTIDPITAAKEVQGLLSPQGRVVPLSNAQRLVVTDFGGNLQQLFEMLWEQETDPANQPQLIFYLKLTMQNQLLLEQM